MSITAAYIENGVVTNMVVMPDDYDNSDPSIVVPDGNLEVTFGWLYDGSVFTMTTDMINNTYNGLVSSANGMIKRLTAQNSPELASWQSYLTQLQAMNLSASNPPQWPVRPD